MLTLRKHFNRLIRCEKGAQAVEFALVAPVLFLMIFGILEIGRYFWLQNTLNYAVQEGTRYAAVSTDISPSDIAALVEERLASVDRALVTITVTSSTDANTGLTSREVTATMPFSLSIGSMLPTQLIITARSQYLVVE